MTSQDIPLGSLTKYRLGSLRGVLSISLPSALMFFSTACMGFCDRLFLAHDSIENLAACVDAAFLCYIFQAALVVGVRATQVFVGECLGQQKYQSIGSHVWQMIWLSILSMAFTLPLGFIAEAVFFRDTSVQEAGTVYFRCLLFFNFLFPVGAALSSFYMGRSKMKHVLGASLGANLVNLVLDPLFIFGWPGICPPMGIFGAALATGIGQGLFCAILFIDFLNKKNREIYGTGCFLIHKKRLWDNFRLGFPKMISRAVSVTIWVANVRIMTIKGEDHLLVLSFGSSIALLVLFLNEGLWQAVFTIVSYALGKKDDQAIARLLRSGLLCLLIFSIFAAIPCLIFPKWFIDIFFTKTVDTKHIGLLIDTGRWLWIFCISHGLTGTFLLLVAKKDTLFTMYYHLFFAWLLNYIPVLIAIDKLNWSADKFYLILACGNCASALFYFVRFKRLWKPTLNHNLQSV